MQEIPVPPMPPAPAGAKQPEPVSAREQPPVYRCHVRYDLFLSHCSVN